MKDMGKGILVVFCILLAIGGIRSCIDQKKSAYSAYSRAFNNAYDLSYPDGFNEGNQFFFKSTYRPTRVGWYLTIIDALIIFIGIYSLRDFGLKIGKNFKLLLIKLSLIRYIQTNPNFKNLDLSTSDNLENLRNDADKIHYSEIYLKYKELRKSLRDSTNVSKEKFHESCKTLKTKIRAQKASENHHTTIIPQSYCICFFIMSALFLSSCETPAEAQARGRIDGEAAGERAGYWDGTWNFLQENIWTYLGIAIGLLLIIMLVYLLIIKIRLEHQTRSIERMENQNYEDEVARVKYRFLQEELSMPENMRFQTFTSKWIQEIRRDTKNQPALDQYYKESISLTNKHLSEALERERDFMCTMLDLIHHSQMRPEYKIKQYDKLKITL